MLAWITGYQSLAKLTLTITNTFCSIEKLLVVSMVSMYPILLSCTYDIIVIQWYRSLLFKNVFDRLLTIVFFFFPPHSGLKQGPRRFEFVTYLTGPLGSIKIWWELSLYGTDAWPKGSPKIAPRGKEDQYPLSLLNPSFRAVGKCQR